MVNTSFILAAAVTAAQAVYAVGTAKVVNNCPFAVSTWSVGSDISPATRLRPGGSYSERYTRDPKTGGRDIKITREPDGLFTGKPLTIFAYNLDGSGIWYDLSDKFGDPFKGRKVVLASNNSYCGVINWNDGIPPAGSQVKVCNADADITLTLCAQ